jgi:alpha-soluble NSF attachment protein
MSRPAKASSSGVARSPPPKDRSADDSDEDDVPASKKAAAGPYRTDPKGDELVKEAQKKLKGGFMAMFSSENKYETAIELYEKAAAQYKMNKNWQEAGEVYVTCAEIFTEKLKSAHDAGVAYENAAKAFKNVNIKEAIRCYNSAVDILMDNNKFSMAAKIWKEMAILQEKEHDLAAAMTSYQKAADCFVAENSVANSSGMLVKVAALAAEQEDYKKAISIYEKVAKDSLENSALKWSVKDYLFRALLCHFVMNAKTHRLETVQSKLEQYLDLCPMLDNTREKGLIEDLIEDFNNDNPDSFADHVFKFDEIIKLDNWTAKVLLEIKKALETGGEGGDVDV